MSTRDAGLQAEARLGTSKVRGMLDAARISTRLWFDLIAPATMMLVASHGRVPMWPFGGVLAIAVLFHAAANYFNDLADTEVDRQSSEAVRNQRALVTARVSRSDLQVAAWTMVGVAVAISAVLPWPSLGIMVVILAMAIAYDFEPLHLSNRPLILQAFWPVVWTLMYTLCAVAVGGSSWRDGLPFLVFVAIFMGFGEGITQDVRDVDNDHAGGRRTTPAVFGVSLSVTVAWWCQLLSLAAWVWFAASYPVPVIVAIPATLSIVVWLGYFSALVVRLRQRFEKAPARTTHIGPIIAFSIVNVCTMIGVLIS
jgi:4-hydroxybenzoate polyprenyltransferase